MSAPSLAEVRAGGQPPGLKDRRNEEHWAGRLYMRRISPLFTLVFIKIGFSPNQLTYMMIVCGMLGGAAVAVTAHGPPALLWAIVGAVLIQALPPAGLLGRRGRAVPQAHLGHRRLPRPDRPLHVRGRAAGRPRRPARRARWQNGGYIELGLLAALGAALIKAETDNVVVARAKSGLTADPPTGDRALRPESTGLALAREAASLLKLHRIIGAVELSLLIVAAAVVDHQTQHADRDAWPGRRGRGRGRPADRAALRQHRRLAEAQVKLSVVVLTMGNRPVELERAVQSALDLRADDLDIEIVLVGNGADVPGTWPDAVTVIRLPENVGIPAGRNRGAEASSGELVVFLDDDGFYDSRDARRPPARPVHRRPVPGRRVVPRTRPGGRPRRAAARPAAARRRPAAVLGRHDVPGRRLRDPARGVRRRRAACRRTSSTPTRRPTSPGRP